MTLHPAIRLPVLVVATVTSVVIEVASATVLCFLTWSTMLRFTNDAGPDIRYWLLVPAVAISAAVVLFIRRLLRKTFPRLRSVI